MHFVICGSLKYLQTGLRQGQGPAPKGSLLSSVLVFWVGVHSLKKDSAFSPRSPIISKCRNGWTANPRFSCFISKEGQLNDILLSNSHWRTCNRDEEYLFLNSCF